MDTTESLDLSALPAIFILPNGIESSTLHEVEDLVLECRGNLTYNPTEARVFVTKNTQRKRVAFELRRRGIWTEPVETTDSQTSARKRRKLASQHDDESAVASASSFSETQVIVLRLEWLYKSFEAGTVMPCQSFIVHRGEVIPQHHIDGELEYSTSAATSDGRIVRLPTQEMRTRTFADRFPRRRFKDGHNQKSTSILAQLQTHPRLHHATTSEHDLAESHNLPPPPAWLSGNHPQYSCLRSTPADPPNKQFLAHLYKIKEARVLTLDEIGVRAYSTAIASISALDREITNAHEITRLPGCSDKIAMLWIEWVESATEPSQRTLSITTEIENDPDLRILKLFWNVYGVGPETARKLYLDKGWKDLDDLVEFGWNSALTRVQQIGVKYYADFLLKIPRREVEAIADVILHHARLAAGISQQYWSNADGGHHGSWSKPDDGQRDPTWNPNDICAVIVGGYRRGKTESGDVDIILSHRDASKTQDLIIDVVLRLERAGYISHTLSLHTINSARDQQTQPFRGHNHHHGFDTLDKALCVWQDPHPDYTGKSNPNPHRRVDIIVSPWHTIGAAVLGWSGATTFERDIRQWCAKVKGWKFDSNGVRDRVTGEVIDLESPTEANLENEGEEEQKDETTASEDEKEKEKADTRIRGRKRRFSCKDETSLSQRTETARQLQHHFEGWQDRERRLMRNLGISWRPARERCTG